MHRPIYTFRMFLRERFPFEVRKLPIHTFLGCPHRDKETGEGGCIYCYDPAFSTISENLPDVEQQVRDGINNSRARGFKGKFLAYFQTGTNTNADIQVLEPWFRLVEKYPDDIIGLAVGTRPDCLADNVIELLAELGKRIMVWVELGLQSSHDKTLSLINRGHNYACFVDAVQGVRAFNSILVSAHIILGLPQENEDDMLHTIREINSQNLDGVKIHHLQVVKNTVLAEWYAQGKVRVFTEQEYINLVTSLLPYLSGKISVHRLIGDVRNDLLIAPHWTMPKTKILQIIEKELEKRGTYQGKKVE